MSNESNEGGIGFVGLLQILFIGLKLGGVINWSWWLVLLPAFSVICLFAFVVVLAIIVNINN